MKYVDFMICFLTLNWSSYHADPKEYIRKVIPTKVSLNSLDFVLSLNASGDVFDVNFFTCLNDYRTRGRDIRSSAFKNEMCIDSVEQPTGSDVELYECHGEGRNQVNFSSFCMLITSFASYSFNFTFLRHLNLW